MGQLWLSCGDELVQSWFSVGSDWCGIIVYGSVGVQQWFSCGKLVLRCGSDLVQCWLSGGAVCVQVGFSVGSWLCGSLVHSSGCF